MAGLFYKPRNGGRDRIRRLGASSVRRTLRASVVTLAQVGVLLGPESAFAQDPPTAAPTPDPNKQLAKERFQQGHVLFTQEAWGPALAEMLESIRLYPTAPATAQAAFCLKKLARYDESLELYAKLVRDFGPKLEPASKQQILNEIEETKRLVGIIEIKGSVPGAVIAVDQRKRGDYPLLEALRVPAGSHVVRVHKEGYEPFETLVDVAGATTQHVQAALIKLKATGALQVFESTGKELSVVVDGVDGDGAVAGTPRSR